MEKLRAEATRREKKRNEAASRAFEESKHTRFTLPLSQRYKGPLAIPEDCRKELVKVIGYDPQDETHDLSDESDAEETKVLTSRRKVIEGGKEASARRELALERWMRLESLRAMLSDGGTLNRATNKREVE